MGQEELFDLFSNRSNPDSVRVGTSGYSFADWVGPFYPSRTKPADMLKFYQRHFNTVEINATYYRIPPVSTMQRMVERTPNDFRFMVKLPGSLTHKRDGDLYSAAAFQKSISPMIESGKFAGALAQFPFSFRFAENSRGYLKWLRDALGGVPLFLEFRHALQSVRKVP